MGHVRVITIDTDHHIEEWSVKGNGAIRTGRFESHRTGKGSVAEGS